VRERIDAESLTFGVTTWHGDRPVRADTTIAKNYLHEDEVRTPDRLATQFLDYAEGQAKSDLTNHPIHAHHKS